MVLLVLYRWCFKMGDDVFRYCCLPSYRINSCFLFLFSELCSAHRTGDPSHGWLETLRWCFKWELYSLSFPMVGAPLYVIPFTRQYGLYIASIGALTVIVLVRLFFVCSARGIGMGLTLCIHLTSSYILLLLPYRTPCFWWYAHCCSFVRFTKS